MLNDFVTLEKGEWVVQNGANSAVGQAVIQIAASRGLKTLNLVRSRFVQLCWTLQGLKYSLSRPDFSELATRLKSLGGTEVLTYDDLADRNLTNTIVKDWTSGKVLD